MNKVKVHCLGPEGTYGHEVAQSVFGQNLDETIFHHSNPEILFSLQEENSDLTFAVVPIENSKGGLVLPIVNDFWLPQMLSGDVCDLDVVGQYRHFVTHNLVAKFGRKDKVKRIFSHPQALSQCEDNIHKLEKISGVRIELIETSSTAGSVDRIERCGDAAICSKTAALIARDEKKLTIVSSHFNDHDDNQTLFHIATKKPHSNVGNTHSAILFTMEDRPNALVEALICISSVGANMQMIHSIPTGIPGKYAFYIEYDEPCETERGKEIILRLENVTDNLLILGSFKQIEKGGVF